MPENTDEQFPELEQNEVAPPTGADGSPAAPEIDVAGYFGGGEPGAWKKPVTPNFPMRDMELRGRMFEAEFQDTYGAWAETQGLSTDSDAVEHQYDYRAAHAEGLLDLDAAPGAHLPSKYKLEGHENLLIPASEAFKGMAGLQGEFSDEALAGNSTWKKGQETDRLDIGLGPGLAIDYDPDQQFDTRTMSVATPETIEKNRELKAWIADENRGLNMPPVFVQRALVQEVKAHAGEDTRGVGYEDSGSYFLNRMGREEQNEALKEHFNKNGYIWDDSMRSGPGWGEREDAPDLKTIAGSDQGGIIDGWTEALKSLGDPMDRTGASIADHSMLYMQDNNERMLAQHAKLAREGSYTWSQDRLDKLKDPKFRESQAKKYLSIANKGFDRPLPQRSGFSLEGAYIAAGLGAANFVGTLQNLGDFIGASGAYYGGKVGLWDDPGALMDTLISDVANRSARMSEDHDLAYKSHDSHFFLDVVSLTTELSMDIAIGFATGGGSFYGKAAMEAAEQAGKLTTRQWFKSIAERNVLKAGVASGDFSKGGLRLADKLQAERMMMLGTRGFNKSDPAARIIDAAGKVIDPVKNLRVWKKGLHGRLATMAIELNLKGAGVRRAMVEQLIKPMKGTNPFISRMYGNAAANSLVEANARAKERGTEIGFADLTWAHLDGLNLAAASWVLHASGVAPQAIGLLKPVFGSTPKALHQAIVTTTLRTAKYGTKSGIGFVAYESMIDSWQYLSHKQGGDRGLREREEIVALWDKFAESDNKLGNTMHSFLLGAVQGWIFRGASAVKTAGKGSAPRQYLEYYNAAFGRKSVGGKTRKSLAEIHEKSKKGTIKRGLAGAGAQVAGAVERMTSAKASAIAWQKLHDPALKEELLDLMSRAQRDAVLETVEYQKRLVKNGEVDLSHLSEKELGEIIALGEKNADDMTIIEMDPAVASRASEGGALRWRQLGKINPNHEKKIKSDKRGRNLVEGEHGTEIGVTKSMARAELSSRGVPINGEPARTINGEVRSTVESREARVERLKLREDAFDKYEPARKPAAADIQASPALRNLFSPGRMKGFFNLMSVPSRWLSGQRSRMTNADQVALYDLAHSEAMNRAASSGDLKTLEALRKEKNNYQTDKTIPGRIPRGDTARWPVPRGWARSMNQSGRPPGGRLPPGHLWKAGEKGKGLALVDSGIQNTLAMRLGGDAVHGEFMKRRGYGDSASGKIINDFVKANPKFAMYVSNKVKANQNTQRKPAINRDDLAALLGGPLGEGKGINSTANRFLLSEAIAASARESAMAAPAKAPHEGPGGAFAPERTAKDLTQTVQERLTERENRAIEREVNESNLAAERARTEDLELPDVAETDWAKVNSRSAELHKGGLGKREETGLDSFNERLGRLNPVSSGTIPALAPEQRGLGPDVRDSVLEHLNRAGVENPHEIAGPDAHKSGIGVTIDTKDSLKQPGHDVVMERARNRGVSVAYVSAPKKDGLRPPTSTVISENVIVFDSKVDAVTAMHKVNEHIAIMRTMKKWRDMGYENPLGMLDRTIGDPVRNIELHEFMSTLNPNLRDAPFALSPVTLPALIKANLFGTKATVQGTEVVVNPMSFVKNDAAAATFLFEALQSMSKDTRGRIVRANQRAFSHMFTELLDGYEDLGYRPVVPKTQRKKGEPARGRNFFATERTRAWIQNRAETPDKEFREQEKASKKGPWAGVHGRKALVEMFDRAYEASSDPRKISNYEEVQRRVGLRRFGKPVVEELLESVQYELLHDGKRYLRDPWNSLTDMFPDIRPVAMRALRNAKPGETVQFDLDGNSFFMLVAPSVGKNKRRTTVAQSISFVPHAAEEANHFLSSHRLSDRDARIKQRLLEMLGESETRQRNESHSKPIEPETREPGNPESVNSESGVPPTEPPVAEGATGGVPPTKPPVAEGTAGAPSEKGPVEAEREVRTTADHKGLSLLAYRAERVFASWWRDPLSRSLTLGDDNNRKAMEDFINLDLEYSGKENEARLALEKDLVTLGRLTNSSLVESSRRGPKNIKSKDLFGKLLDKYIDPKEIDTHKDTKNLLKVEKDVIRRIKVFDEEIRQELMKDRREMSRVVLNGMGRADSIVKMLNEDYAANVELSKSGRAHVFTHNGVEFAREKFIEHAINDIMVPESWGRKFSHFPHSFMGGVRIEITVKQGPDEAPLKFKGGVDPNRIKRGIFETAKGAEMRLAIEDARKKVAELKQEIANPEELTFEFEIVDIKRATPVEAVYLPKRMRQQMQKAASEHSDLNRGDLNRILARGGVRSRPTPTPFFANILERKGDSFGWSTDVGHVMSVYYSNHFRFMKGREFQKRIDPTIQKIEAYDAHLAKDLRDLSNHILYADRGIIAGAFAEEGTMGLSNFLVKSAQNLRGVQFYRHLLRPAQHAINSTQVSQIAAVIGAKNFAKFATQYNTNRKDRHEVLSEFGSFDAYGKWQDGKFGDIYSGAMVNGLEKIHFIGNKVIGKVWNASSEARNQNVAFYTMFKHATENMGMKPVEAAKYARLYGQVFTQYRFTKANDPKVLRGQWAKTLGQFKRFQIQSLGLGYALAKMDPQTRTSLGISGRTAPFMTWMLTNLAFAGYRGSLMGMFAMGGVGLTRKAYDGISSIVDDEHIPSGSWAFEDPGKTYLFIKRTLGKKAADVFMGGLPAAALNMQMSASFNLVEFPYGSTALERVGRYAAGPSGSMFGKLYDDVTSPQVRHRSFLNKSITSVATGGAATKWAMNVYKTIAYWDELGESAEFRDIVFGTLQTGAAYRDKTGALIDYTTREQSLINALGAQHVDQASLSWLRQTGLMIQQEYNEAADKTATMWRTHPEKAQRMRDEWNRRYGQIPGAYMFESDLYDRAKRKLESQNITRPERDLKHRLGSKAEAIQNWFMQQAY